MACEDRTRDRITGGGDAARDVHLSRRRRREDQQVQSDGRCGACWDLKASKGPVRGRGTKRPMLATEMRGQGHELRRTEMR